MNTALRVVDGPPLDDRGYPNPWAAEPGDMWACKSPGHVVEGRASCWIIRLPDRAWVWHTNEQAGGDGPHWTVTGEPPAITVTPSINVGPEIWHGWITDGVMTP